jgi:hypothetical protein
MSRRSEAVSEKFRRGLLIVLGALYGPPVHVRHHQGAGRPGRGPAHARRRRHAPCARCGGRPSCSRRASTVGCSPHSYCTGQPRRRHRAPATARAERESRRPGRSSHAPAPDGRSHHRTTGAPGGTRIHHPAPARGWATPHQRTGSTAAVSVRWAILSATAHRL